MEAHGTSHGNFHGNLHGKVHGNLHGNVDGNPRQAPTAYHGRQKKKGKIYRDAYCMEMAPCPLPWYFRGLRWLIPRRFATERTAARAMATTVALAVEAPCTMESCGSCRGISRIPTITRGKTHGRPRELCGHCRGPPLKSRTL